MAKKSDKDRSPILRTHNTQFRTVSMFKITMNRGSSVMKNTGANYSKILSAKKKNVASKSGSTLRPTCSRNCNVMRAFGSDNSRHHLIGAYIKACLVRSYAVDVSVLKPAN